MEYRKRKLCPLCFKPTKPIRKGNSGSMQTNRAEQVNLFPIDRVRQTDIPDVVRLSARIGWDYSEEEMEVVLRSGHFFAHRGPGGKVVSTAAIFPYSTLASLGVVMVDPDYRRRGLATRLVDACISAVPDRPILLVATEEGKPLYEKLGFKTVGTLDKLVAKRYTGGLQRMTHQQTVHPASEKDIEEIIDLDEKAFGARRERLLRLRIKQAAFGAVLRNRTGKAVGFALGVPGPELMVIDPVVAPDEEAAALLIDRIAGWAPGPMRIDIPSQHQRLADFLTRCGFETVRKPPVMMRNGSALPPREHLFAVASQAFG